MNIYSITYLVRQSIFSALDDIKDQSPSFEFDKWKNIFQKILICSLKRYIRKDIENKTKFKFDLYLHF